MARNEVQFRITADGRVLVAEAGKAEKAIHSIGQTALRAGETAERGFGRARQGVESISQQLSRLQTVIGGALAFDQVAGGAGQLIVLNDELTNLDSRLKLVTHGSQNLAEVQARLFNQSQDSQTNWRANTELFVQMTRATQSLGRSQAEVLRFTDLVSKGLIVSGAAGESATAALMQFSQAMQSGTLRGDEFNSINEQAPILMEALASGLGVARGKLRELAEDGRLTAAVVFPAMLKGLASVEGQFRQMTPTVARAGQELRDNLAQSVHQFDSLTGTSAAIAQSLSYVSRHLDEVGMLLATVGLVGVGHLGKIAGAAVAAALAKRAAAVAAVELARAEYAAALAANAYGTASGRAAAASEALALAQRNASLAAAGMAGAAGLARGALALLGGPIGIAITALGLLALNWDKVGDSAVSAANAAKVAASEIQKALQDGKVAVATANRDRIKQNLAEADEGAQLTAALVKTATTPEFKAAYQKQHDDWMKIREDNRAALLEADKDIAEWKTKQREAALGDSANIIYDRYDYGLKKPEQITLPGGKPKKPKADAGAIQSATDTDMANLRARIEAARQAGEQQQKLTEGERLVLQTEEKLAAAKDAKTRASLQAYLVGAKELALVERSNQVQGEARRQAEELAEQRTRDLEGMGRELAGLQERVDTYGMSEGAIASYTAAKTEQLLVEAQEKLLLDPRNEALRKEISYLRQKRDLQLQLAGRQGELDSLDAAAKAREARRKELEDLARDERQQAEQQATEIRQGLTDALMRGFEQGKNAAQNFRDTLKNMFMTLILRPRLEAIMTPAANAASGLLTTALKGLFGGIGGMAGSFANDGTYSLTGFQNVLPSAANGYDIPAGVNPLTQLHEEEMVLPKAHANVIRDLARNGGAGGNNVNLQVNVQNYGNEPVQTRQTTRGGQPALDVVIGDAVAGQMRRTGSTTQRALRDGFGMTPQLVGR